jgi:SAM-dependent methyltransferase
VLEIGCAIGSLLAVVRDAGHEVAGLDLPARFARAAADIHQLDVIVGDVATATFASESFDLVVLAGTLPNLHILSECLQRIYLWLEPGGCLVANFPASDSLNARLYRSLHWMFAPSVNTLPSTAGCRIAFTNAGFVVRHFRNDLEQPSWLKLMTLSRLPCSGSQLGFFGLRGKILPMAMRAPGVRIIASIKPFQAQK